ncbi:MAG: L-ribulose-5-phosphate 4-epimerase AraD [Candidatus Aminicenantales bacterium]
MLKELREHVWKANCDLGKYGLVAHAFGNASGIDRSRGLIVIKPSGMACRALTPEDMVTVDLEGRKVEGRLNPCSDTPSHIEIYKGFEQVSGVCQAHSEYATMFGRAGREILCLGTTHADNFRGPVPLARMITAEEIAEGYETNTGRLVVERFAGIDPLETPAVLIPGHGVFTWGDSAEQAVLNGMILERVARMAWGTLMLSPGCESIPECLREKHFGRKHGPDAYYGQKKRTEES